MSAEIPNRLGRYEIQEEIGRGMMGIVYRALDPELNRVVALKTVHLAWAISDEDREIFEQRFTNEARVAASLAHPGIMVVHDVGRDAATGTLFIALEFLQGRTLGELTAGGKALDWKEALRLTARVAEALQHAHERGVVHRDVKPANVMVLPSGEPKIMDFGIAKVPTSELTAAGEFFGTPSYMSPEQAASGTVDGRSDLFSLGSVLYLLLTGRRAFDAQGVAAILARVAHQDPPPPSRVAPGVPADVDYVIARALAKDPDQRYPDARRLAEDLSDVLDGRPARHRAGWTAPTRADGTLVSEQLSPEPETADLRQTTRPTLPGAARTLRAGGGQRNLLGALAVLVVGAVVFLVARGATRPPAQLTTPPSPPATTNPMSTAPAETGLDATQAPDSGSWLPQLTLVAAPAKLELVLEHGVKSGALKVFVDDTVVLERDLGAPVRRKILFHKFRKQWLRETFDVQPGEHTVRVQVAASGDVWTERLKGTFESGQARRIIASFGGIIGKELELGWGANPAR
jgi:eukaryotic-like serine/threonine-protein kinase